MAMAMAMAMEAPWLQELLATTSVFSESEIAEMENLFRQVRKEALTQEFYQDLATSFSSSTCRIGKPSISWQQVHNWFQDKQKGIVSVKNTPMSTLSSKAPETSMVLKGGTASEIADLAYEAKSSRDNAWYDVGTFLNYRFLASGELVKHGKSEKLFHEPPNLQWNVLMLMGLSTVCSSYIRLDAGHKVTFGNASYIVVGNCLIDEEVRVRFSGFGVSHDEWVNVKIGVRERSIPLEPSECHKIKVGDLVLCYQERLDYAVYVDAHVMEIQRMLHDIKGCRCIFVVRFDDDKTEEKVQLNKICCRPK